MKIEEKRLFLPNTKNGKSRSIILNDRAMAVLKDLEADKDKSDRTKGSDYLFPSRGGSRRPFILDMRIPFGKVCESAGIEGLHIHDLRHSFATLAIQGGASLYDVSKLLGHSDVSMSQRYAHVSDDSLQKATDNMAGVIDRAIGSRTTHFIGGYSSARQNWNPARHSSCHISISLVTALAASKSLRL